MNLSKQLSLHAYYYATLPWRAIHNSLEAKKGRAPLMVLFYHRIADEHPNDWTMPKEIFRRQIEWLRGHFDMISLSELQRRMAEGHNDRPAVAITFDDGYAENCDFALPLLVEHKIPCTYFVTLENVLTAKPFPHDLQNGRPLPPNNLEQLHDMIRQGIEIGGHTRTHPNLGAVTDVDMLFDEIVTASVELQQLLDQPIQYFAFPFGLPCNLSSAGTQMAREHGFAGICSAYGGYNRVGGDLFHLQRIHADPETIRLRNWLTVDPRKRDIGGFDYHHPAAISAARSVTERQSDESTEDSPAVSPVRSP